MSDMRKSSDLTSMRPPQIAYTMSRIRVLAALVAIVALAVLLTHGEANAQMTDAASFKTAWRTTAANETVTLPLVGSGINIDWGDGDTADNVSGTVSHTYADPGYHAVSVSGGLQAISLENHADAPKLMSIDQWGNATWVTMEDAFAGASNMLYGAADAPDLSGVASLAYMFADTDRFNGDLSSWDVSGVTDMGGMFRDATSFNGDLSSWDVSGVTGMVNMFRDATSFNGDLSSWDVSGVTGMVNMFHGATSFNGDLSSWDVSKVTDMGAMFFEAHSFNGDLSAWDVSGVTDMFAMFHDATSFNGAQIQRRPLRLGRLEGD